MIPALIDSGANIEARSQRLRTPLYVATSFGSLAAMLSLLQMGAKVDAKDKDGMTALHIACRKGRANATDLLLRWGADETDNTKSGREDAKHRRSRVPRRRDS